MAVLVSGMGVTGVTEVTLYNVVHIVAGPCSKNRLNFSKRISRKFCYNSYRQLSTLCRYRRVSLVTVVNGDLGYPGIGWGASLTPPRRNLVDFVAWGFLGIP